MKNNDASGGRSWEHRKNVIPRLHSGSLIAYFILIVSRFCSLVLIFFFSAIHTINSILIQNGKKYMAKGKKGGGEEHQCKVSLNGWVKCVNKHKYIFLGFNILLNVSEKVQLHRRVSADGKITFMASDNLLTLALWTNEIIHFLISGKSRRRQESLWPLTRPMIIIFLFSGFIIFTLVSTIFSINAKNTHCTPSIASSEKHQIHSFT